MDSLHFSEKCIFYLENHFRVVKSVFSQFQVFLGVFGWQGVGWADKYENSKTKSEKRNGSGMRRRADTRHCWERLTEHCHNAFSLSHTTQSQLLSTNTQIHKYTNHKYKYTKAQILNDRTLPQCFLSLTHHPVTTPPSAQLVKEPVCTESRNTVIFK